MKKQTHRPTRVTPTAPKGRQTPRQSVHIAEKRGHGDRIRQWLQERTWSFASTEQPTGSRGVDRVPEHLTKGNPLQRPPRVTGPVGVQKLQRDPEKQYGDERPRTFPTRVSRTPRRRFMPGAEARRIERNRKAWAARS